MSNDSSGPRIILKNSIPLSVPLCVYIDVTNRCNFTCPWCPTGYNLQKKLYNNAGTMKLSLFKKITKDFEILTKNKKQRIRTLALFMMGEPLLHKNYFEMVRIAKKADIADKIMTSTNGSLINEEVCKNIVESGLDLVSISMYGCSNEEYKKISKHFDFDTILNNSKKLIEYREKCNSKMPKVFLKYFENSKEVRAKKDYLLDYCDHIAFEEPFNWNSTYTKEIGVFIDPREKKSARYCSQPWYVMSIGWDGSVLVCCADWSWNTKVGNLAENSVEEIWHGKGYLLFRKKIVQGLQNENLACHGCNAQQVNDEASNIDDLIMTNSKKALEMPK